MARRTLIQTNEAVWILPSGAFAGMPRFGCQWRCPRDGIAWKERSELGLRATPPKSSGPARELDHNCRFVRAVELRDILKPAMRLAATATPG